MGLERIKFEEGTQPTFHYWVWIHPPYPWQTLVVHCSVGYSTGYENQGKHKGWALSVDLTQLLRENAITFQWK